MKLFASRSGLIFQFIALLTATSVVTGGGQFPGNTARIAIYLKFILFMLPVLGFAQKALCDKRFLIMERLFILIKRNILFVLFLTSLLLSIPLSTYPFFSLQRCLYTYLGFISLFCLIAQYEYEQNDSGLYLNSIIGSAILVIICVAPLALSSVSLRMAIQSTNMIHPNMLSSLMAQLMLALFFLPGTALQSRLKYGLTAVLCIGIIVLQSRGVWISLIVAGLIGLSANSCVYKNRMSFIALCFALFAISLVTLFCLLIPELPRDILSVLSRGQSIDDMLTLTNRITLWQNIMSTISLKQILVGHGYALINEHAVVDFGNGILFGAHNAYLSIFLGAGLFSLLLLLAYWLIVVIRMIQFQSILERPLVLLTVCSITLLFVSGITGEEFGLHLTPTFLLLFFHAQRIFYRRSQS